MVPRGPPGQCRWTKVRRACSIEAPMPADDPTLASEAAPHYLRFARSLALVGALGVAVSGCCPMIPDSVACAHCVCSGQTRTSSQPLSCDTIHRDAVCCARVIPVIGPLSPPNLRA